MYDEQVVFGQGYGVMRQDMPIPPAESTIFRIGSLSKVFTTLIALSLRDQGKLNLEQQVTEFFPQFNPINPVLTARGTSIRDLGSHMAGLARESPCNGNAMNFCNSILPYLSLLAACSHQRMQSGDR